MTGQKLSDIKSSAEIAAIAVKGYKESAATKIVERLKKEVPETLTNASMSGYLTRLQNLTGPRTLEGRMRSLSNLTAGNKKSESKDGDKITLLDENDPLRHLLLDDTEVKFYQDKKAAYEAEFKFNFSSDQLVLEQILLEEITLFRLRKAQKNYIEAITKNPKQAKYLTNPNRQIAESIKNIKVLVEKLAVDRKQRTGGKDSIGDDVASLSRVYEEEYTDTKYENAEVAEKADEEEEKEVTDFVEKSQELRLKELKKMGLA